MLVAGENEKSENSENPENSPENEKVDVSDPASDPDAPAKIDDVIKKATEQVNAASSAPLKRKRGRPPKRKVAHDPIPAAAPSVASESIAPIAPQTDYRPMIRDLAGMLDGQLVERLGSQKAALLPEEKERAAECLNPLFQKWFPDVGELTPELAAVIGLGSIAYAVHARVEADRKAQTATASSAPAPVASPNVFPWPSA